MSPSEWECQILWTAALGRVLENVHESAPAVGAVYRRLDVGGLIAAEWGDGDLPVEVELTAAGRALLRSLE